MRKKTYFLISIILNIFLLGYIIYIKSSKNNQELALYRKYKTSDTILFIGNSIIARCNWNELLDSKNIINDGVGGITSYEIFLKLSGLLKTNPKKIFFEMGSNDIYRNAYLQDVMDNFHNILYTVKIKCPLAKIYFMSVLPNEESRIEFRGINGRIDDLNSTIEVFCKKYNVVYVDVNSLLKNNDGKLSHEYSLDGSHLTPLGYEKIKYKMKFYLNEKF